ncbi:MAG: CDP-alcohol phosphatidyltransferase family protein [Candidatus Ancillula sp.]|jgi:cardiolipin synthase|nr:CDP-alcohol phosphatidyltransferase family protein [Candidatus Ancillula sp.]
MAVRHGLEHIKRAISADGATNELVTIPNCITLLRLLLVPFFAMLSFQGHDLAALIIVIICSLSDFLDGFLARKFNQVTKFGRIADPLADRLLIFTVLLLLMLKSIIPLWFFVAVLARDLFLFLIYTFLVLNKREPPAVRFVGKVGAAGLMFGLPLIYLCKSPELGALICSDNSSCLQVLDMSSNIANVVLVISLVVYLFVGLLYLRDSIKLMKRDDPA